MYSLRASCFVIQSKLAPGLTIVLSRMNLNNQSFALYAFLSFNLCLQLTIYLLKDPEPLQSFGTEDTEHNQTKLK